MAFQAVALPPMVPQEYLDMYPNIQDPIRKTYSGSGYLSEEEKRGN